VSPCARLRHQGRRFCQKRASAPERPGVGQARATGLQRFTSISGFSSKVREKARGVRVARYYDPSNDQFLTLDLDVSQTLAPFSYAGDDPVNEIDPVSLANVNNYSETECELSGNRSVPKGSAPGVGNRVPVSQTPLLAQTLLSRLLRNAGSSTQLQMSRRQFRSSALVPPP
jgi:hypothetical protein